MFDEDELWIDYYYYESYVYECDISANDNEGGRIKRAYCCCDD